MRIAIASDHRGFQMKSRLQQTIENLGFDVDDLGPESGDSVDYPDYAARVAASVAADEHNRGILICGTGIGMCITANKFAGVRAAPCHDTVTAEYSRLHNDANILCLSANQLSDQLAEQMIQIWLSTDFEEGRHARRIEKIADIERDASNPFASETPGCGG
ncbi:MAG: ribose 5-phosphate isomerase B [Fuerstiella sp.]|nr:ribose 5-phosphate isomerase B [Fuerstiella sp.]